ncbi:bifunctional alpha/beta hydrolase/OsmC family protein [Rhodobium gokarnense]|uniref:Redox protein n=1 Tax=Rhodobium gokarnense TaxID=364296 RepID=A0ABT3HBZ8_9HYPH|nr:bifunctional alpha/beta hydrolase/OsmC family protein [Rhodobium gokarnense]MCW2307874.1 putative redox protein [Rhodobium gokarnense]
MSAEVQRISFKGSLDKPLSARLDLPAGTVRATALLAHCFTCSKDLAAVRRIAGELARHGFAVLRFDFTGLGSSEGEFANTDFSSNVGDILAAAEYLRRNFEAPKLLIGHSLGGAAVLTAAPRIPEAVAVATIGAPADAEHVTRSFHAHLDEIENTGSATVTLAGREFRIRDDFLADVRGQNVHDCVKAMKKALLILHAPRDEVVDIENATALFVAAKHPKSFISLDTADHLISDPSDAAYAAKVIAAWAGRYVGAEPPAGDADDKAIRVSETGEGTFQAYVQAGRHRLLADEPEGYGGNDTGPSPYDYLSVALGACTTMTLRMYADHKKLPVEHVSVEVSHGKVHAADCQDCSEEVRGRGGKIDRFERMISIDGDLDAETRERMRQIADRCPVHKTLHAGAAVVTRLVDSD